METTYKQPPKHVFLSYATSAAKVAEKLSGRFQESGIPIWIDRERLKPGTASWQTAIRTAIAESVAVVVVASPGTSESVYVDAEVALAKKEDRLLLPVWAVGDDWIDCIPLQINGHQYIDVRGGRYNAGDAKLVDQLTAELREQQPRLFLTDHTDHYPGRVSIELPKGVGSGVVSVYTPAYPSLQSLLDELYMRFLSSHYAPRSYGREWIIANVSSEWLNNLITTWDWITKRDAISALDQNWASSPPESWGLGAGSSWGILDHDLSSRFVFGLAVADSRLFHMSPYDLAKRLLTAYYSDTIGPVEVVDPRQVKPNEYPWSAVLTCEPEHLHAVKWNQKNNYAAFVQSSYLTTPNLIV